MDGDNGTRGENAVTNRLLAPLDRARRVSESLSQAARRARFSARSRRYTRNGFSDRAGQGLFDLFVRASLWLVVLLPLAVTSGYLFALASDQYASEFKFTVSGSEPPVADGIGMLTGLPSLSVVQDTQIIANHLQSRAVVTLLEKNLGLRSLYADPAIDWYARFNPEKPIERLVKYWQGMIGIGIQMPSGIVDVQVRAFSPEAARDISLELIRISENLINEMNERMNRDALLAAEADLERASARLSKARISLQRARNEAGLLDVEQAADGIGKLITESRRTLLQLEQEYQAQLRSVQETAPQMQNLKARIGATRQQIVTLQAQLTTRAEGQSGALSGAALRFSELELERQIAEKLYAGAITALEVARITAERKRLYLNTFVAPVLAQEAKYPRRFLLTLLIGVGLLALWGALVGMVALVRNHRAA
jgi:capsular polysaccharide transport system permease protein